MSIKYYNKASDRQNVIAFWAIVSCIAGLLYTPVWLVIVSLVLTFKMLAVNTRLHGSNTEEHF